FAAKGPAIGLAASAGRLAAKGFSATRLAAERLVAARTCRTRTLTVFTWPAITTRLVRKCPFATRLVAEWAISPGRTFTTTGTIPEGALALKTAALLVASRRRRFGADPVAIIVGAV